MVFVDLDIDIVDTESMGYIAESVPFVEVALAIAVVVYIQFVTFRGMKTDYCIHSDVLVQDWYNQFDPVFS